MITYFAYGSNMLTARIEERLGRCARVGTGYLKGRQLVFHKRGRDGSGKCDAFETGRLADRVFGVLYRLDRGQRLKLDGFEGPGYESREVVVQLTLDAIEAYTYVAVPSAVERDLVPYSWYKSLVVAGAHAHRLPLPYREMLETFPCMSDPDVERRSWYEALLEAAQPSVRGQ